MKKSLKTLTLGVASTATLMGSAALKAETFYLLEDSGENQNTLVLETNETYLDLAGFIQLSTKRAFRGTYFRNIENLSERFIVSEFTMKQIRELDLAELEAVVEDDSWSRFREVWSGNDMSYTNSHTDHGNDSHNQWSHTADDHNNGDSDTHTQNSHTDHGNGGHNNDTHTSDTRVVNGNDFEWQKLLKKYGEVMPVTPYVEHIIQAPVSAPINPAEVYAVAEAETMQVETVQVETVQVETVQVESAGPETVADDDGIDWF